MSYYLPKPSESQGWLCAVPQGKKAILVRVSIEFNDDEDGADDNVTKRYRRISLLTIQKDIQCTLMDMGQSIMRPLNLWIKL